MLIGIENLPPKLSPMISPMHTPNGIAPGGLNALLPNFRQTNTSIIKYSLNNEAQGN